MSKNKLALNQQHIILKRALVTLAITITYVVLTEIPLPYLNVVIIGKLMQNPKLKVLQVLTLMTGGSLQQGSLMMAGLMPFIMVQFAIQILQVGISKKMKELSESSNGAKKIGQLTKLITFPLALIQSGFILLMLQKLTNGNAIVNGHLPFALVLIYLTVLISAGTMLAIWISDLNTLYGLGMGLNYLVSVSIIVNMIENAHFNFSGLHKMFAKFGPKLWAIVIIALLVFILYNAVCIWYQSSNYEMPIQFAQLDSSVDKTGKLPFTMNIANVMPVILAGMLMNILYALNLFHSRTMQELFNFKSWSSIGTYAVVLILFTFAFTYIQYYPKKLDDGLDRMNAYIIGVDPTLATIKFFNKSLIYLASLNSLFFVIMVIIPMIICKLIGLPESMVLSVSSVIIVVTTEADIRRQVVGLHAKELKSNLFVK